MTPKPGGCPTCSHTMAKLTDHDPIYFTCDRCGTLTRIVGTRLDVYRPKLVDRCRDLLKGTQPQHAFYSWLHRLGVIESIYRPEERLDALKSTNQSEDHP